MDGVLCRFTVVILVIAVLSLYWYFYYLVPSPDLAEFVTTVTNTRKPNVTRIPAKYKMINPTQLFMDYPVASYLTQDVGFKYSKIITANVVSLMHPVFGALAAYCVVCVVRAGRGKIGSAFARKRRGSLTPGGAISEGVADSDLETEDDHMQVVSDGNPRNGSCTNLNATPGNSLLTSQEPGTPTQFSKVTISSASPNTVLPSPLVDFATSMGGNASVTAQQHRLFQFACVFFMMRNFLDTWDGVLARAQKGVFTTTQVGLNGHLLDVITDLFGVTIIGVSLFYYLWSRRQPLHRRAHLVFHHCARQRMSSLTASRVVACVGLIYLSLMGLTWENFMLRYQAVFDVHQLNPEVNQLERNIHVQLSYFLWSLSCGDTMFSYLIIGMWYNRVWEFVQILFFIGYPWLFLVLLHSLYVWNVIVLGNPVVQKLTIVMK